MTFQRVIASAAAAGVAYGFAMAWFAWRWQGSELLLMQAPMFAGAWFAGRFAGGLRSGALAGLLVVAAVVWTYELLPGWGFESRIRDDRTPLSELMEITEGFDAADVVLLTTLLIGALLGAGGALGRWVPPMQKPRPPAVATFEPPVAPETALWAELDPPPAPEPVRIAPPIPTEPPTSRPVVSAEVTRFASAVILAAALSTDVFLGRLFGIYSEPQRDAAVLFVLMALAVTFLLVRRNRHVVGVMFAGAVLALVFAAVQDVEYQSRHPEIAIIR